MYGSLIFKVEQTECPRVESYSCYPSIQIVVITTFISYVILTSSIFKIRTVCMRARASVCVGAFVCAGPVANYCFGISDPIFSGGSKLCDFLLLRTFIEERDN